MSALTHSNITYFLFLVMSAPCNTYCLLPVAYIFSSLWHLWHILLWSTLSVFCDNCFLWQVPCDCSLWHPLFALCDTHCLLLVTFIVYSLWLCVPSDTCLLPVTLSAPCETHCLLHLQLTVICSPWHSLSAPCDSHFAPCDTHYLLPVTLTVCSLWQSLCAPCDTHCLFPVTITVCSMWQSLSAPCDTHFAPCDTHCLLHLTLTVCSQWNVLSAPCENQCILPVTLTVCSLWNPLSAPCGTHYILFFLIFFFYVWTYSINNWVTRKLGGMYIHDITKEIYYITKYSWVFIII